MGGRGQDDRGHLISRRRGHSFRSTSWLWFRKPSDHDFPIKYAGNMSEKNGTRKLEYFRDQGLHGSFIWSGCTT